jgi:hypothetical protein
MSVVANIASWLLASIVLGFVLAAPFMVVKQYSRRVQLSVIVPVILYLCLAISYCLMGACAHPGPPESVLLPLTVGVALGGFCAALLRSLIGR